MGRRYLKFCVLLAGVLVGAGHLAGCAANFETCGPGETWQWYPSFGPNLKYLSPHRAGKCVPVEKQQETPDQQLRQFGTAHDRDRLALLVSAKRGPGRWTMLCQENQASPQRPVGVTLGPWPPIRPMGQGRSCSSVPGLVELHLWKQVQDEWVQVGREALDLDMTGGLEYTVVWQVAGPVGPPNSDAP